MDDIDILDWHYQEECRDQELEDLQDDLTFYSVWVDDLAETIEEQNQKIAELEDVIETKNNKIAELEEKLEHQRRVILSLRNKNSQLIGDIRELLDDKEYEWQHSC